MNFINDSSLSIEGMGTRERPFTLSPTSTPRSSASQKQLQTLGKEEKLALQRLKARADQKRADLSNLELQMMQMEQPYNHKNDTLEDMSSSARRCEYRKEYDGLFGDDPSLNHSDFTLTTDRNRSGSHSRLGYYDRSSEHRLDCTHSASRNSGNSDQENDSGHIKKIRVIVKTDDVNGDDAGSQTIEDNDWDKHEGSECESYSDSHPESDSEDESEDKSGDDSEDYSEDDSGDDSEIEPESDTEIGKDDGDDTQDISSESDTESDFVELSDSYALQNELLLEANGKSNQRRHRATDIQSLYAWQIERHIHWSEKDTWQSISELCSTLDVETSEDICSEAQLGRGNLGLRKEFCQVDPGDHKWGHPCKALIVAGMSSFRRRWDPEHGILEWITQAETRRLLLHMEKWYFSLSKEDRVLEAPLNAHNWLGFPERHSGIWNEVFFGAMSPPRDMEAPLESDEAERPYSLSDTFDCEALLGHLP